MKHATLWVQWNAQLSEMLSSGSSVLTQHCASLALQRQPFSNSKLPAPLKSWKCCYDVPYHIELIYGPFGVILVWSLCLTFHPSLAWLVSDFCLGWVWVARIYKNKKRGRTAGCQSKNLKKMKTFLTGLRGGLLRMKSRITSWASLFTLWGIARGTCDKSLQTSWTMFSPLWSWSMSSLY